MYELATIALATAHPSPTNPRKHFDEAKLSELAASVRQKGILQPLVVRARKAGGHEVVCGERRRRAAKMAGLKEIPVSIAVLDDLEALELQIIENGQRADVHPLEEADGFAALQAAGRSVEQIAAKVGKSTSHVYQRLRLCSLGGVARAAFWDGKIDAAVAQVIARIHNQKLQDQATTELLEDVQDGVPVLLDDARHLVRDRYMLVLAEAPFDRADAKLLPVAGACEACPKRTGAQRELFAEEAKVDHCLDPDCYTAKGDATWQRAAAKAEEGGGAVLSDAETKKAFPYKSSQVAYGSDYTRLGEVCFDDPKRRTYKQLLGSSAKQHVVLARDPLGKVHELVKKSAALSILKVSHKELAKEVERDLKSDTRESTRRNEQALEQERRRKTTAAVIAAVTQKVTSFETKLPDAAWRALASVVLERAHADTHAHVAKRRELESKGSARNAKTLEKHAQQLPVPKLPALIFEVVLTQSAYFGYSDELERELAATAKALGVDTKALRKQVVADGRAKAIAKAAKKTASKKGGARAR